jgi:hypothetical protein
MITIRNHAKERLEAGELVLGVGLRQARTVDIAKIMKTAGYDFLFIDMEHNSGGAGAGVRAFPRDPRARCGSAGHRGAARRHGRNRGTHGRQL